MIASIDSYHTTPGTFTNDLAKFKLFEACGEHVSIGTSELVGNQHQMPPQGMVGVGFRTAPAWHVITQVAMGELFQYQWGNPASSIEADIDDQPLAVDL